MLARCNGASDYIYLFIYLFINIVNEHTVSISPGQGGTACPPTSISCGNAVLQLKKLLNWLEINGMFSVMRCSGMLFDLTVINDKKL